MNYTCTNKRSTVKRDRTLLKTQFDDTLIPRETSATWIPKDIFIASLDNVLSLSREMFALTIVFVSSFFQHCLMPIFFSKCLSPMPQCQFVMKSRSSLL